MSHYADAARPRTQLRELAAAGYPLPWLAARVGMSTSGLQAIQNGRNSRTSTYAALRINATWQQYRGTSPASNGIRPGSTCLARLQAARHGWTTTQEVSA